MVSLVDGVLLAALVGTTACVLPLYLKLKRLDRAQAEYGRAVAASGHALASAGEAVRNFTGEGREILEALSATRSRRRGPRSTPSRRAGAPRQGMPRQGTRRRRKAARPTWDAAASRRPVPGSPHK